MKKLLKNKYAFLLAVFLCLSLTACGGSDSKNSDKAAEDDWRNSGVVVDKGTITHEDEGSVDVLVTVDNKSAAFYRDDPEQILFDSVSFPMEIPDAQEAFEGISFDDLDGDGESDVLVCFAYDSGESIALVWLWDPEERYVYQEDLSEITTNSGDISEYVGLWEYVDEDSWIKINEDETWECMDAQENVFQSGTLSVDSTGITFYSEDIEGEIHFERTESGELIERENDGKLIPIDSIESRVPYFTHNGLEINAAVDMGSYLLENGFGIYTKDGDEYYNSDCYWEIIKNYDETQDGIREIRFDAICYIPKYDSKKYEGTTNSELYDFYTGKWLTTASTYGNSDRGDNYYLHTIEWNGQSEIIEFAYSTDWQKNVGDWSLILTKSYVVYVPEGYDGLIFAAEAAPTNFRDNERVHHLETIYPEANIMDIDLKDPFSALFFNICN